MKLKSHKRSDVIRKLAKKNIGQLKMLIMNAYTAYHEMLTMKSKTGVFTHP